MYIFHVDGKDYKVKFGYGVLYQSDLMDRVVGVSEISTEKPAESIKNFIGLTAELLLAGLQKNYSDEFGYNTDKERKEQIRKVCDLIDDYEDEAEVDENGNRSQDGFTLFTDLQKELEKNGFLSKVLGAAEAQTQAIQKNATVVPMDRQKKSRKAGEKS